MILIACQIHDTAQAHDSMHVALDRRADRIMLVGLESLIDCPEPCGRLEMGRAVATNTAPTRMTPHIVHFDCYEVDLDSGRLRKRGARIKLREQSFQVLALLLEHPGQVVTRDELRQRLWRDEVFVDFEKSLNTAVARLREALGDSADHPHFIETLPKRGYRFVGDVGVTEQPITPSVTQRSRLLVLPFINLSGDPTEDYFCDAMTDDIITVLASVAPDLLAVIARTTSMHYKNNNKGVARMARDLALDYVVEGGVRRSGNQVSINVQLIETRHQTHLFSKKYDSELLNVFRVQNELVQNIAQNIPAIAGSWVDASPAVRFKRKPTNDVVAYKCYMQGRHSIRQWTPECIAKAKRCFEEAIARDPQFALAYASLAEVHAWVGWLGFVAPKDVFPTGVWTALRALELDATIARPHALLAMFRKEHDCDWADVNRRLTLALHLDPSSPEILFWHACGYLLPLGKMDESVVELDRALESDPLSVFLRSWLAVVLSFGRQHDRALKEAHLALELDPNSYIAQFALGHVCRDVGQFAESIAAHRVAVERSGGSPLMLGWLGLPLALSGKTAEARKILEQLRNAPPQTYVPPTSFAWIHLGLGEVDEALLWMDRAIDAQDPMMTSIKTYPFLDPLRSDQRFAGLLRKMKLDF